MAVLVAAFLTPPTLLHAEDAATACRSPGRTEHTQAGAGFAVPTGWSLARRGSRVIIAPPEAAARVVIVDVGPAENAEAAAAFAIRAAFDDLRSDPRRQANVAAYPQGPAEGWDERFLLTYAVPQTDTRGLAALDATAPNDSLIFEARANRTGTNWTVALFEGKSSLWDVLSASKSLVLQSLRPLGSVPETFAGRAAHPLDATRIAAMQGFVQASMTQLGIPGVGLALIDQGRVVFEGGLGVRAVGGVEPVDAHTLFMIGSNTKGMTTLLLSELVDKNKLQWDTPADDVYPGFHIGGALGGNAATTGAVMVRHLVCMCTGLPRQDYEWKMNSRANTAAGTTFAVLTQVKPTSAFGQQFQYSNRMGAAAGYIAAHVVYPGLELGAAYDAAMQDMVFDPLGMTETTFDTARAQAGDHASPHAQNVHGSVAQVSMDPNASIVALGPAGGAWSSAHDMTKYVQSELAEGQMPDGTQLVSAKNLLARRACSVVFGEDETYGMGLLVNTHYGIPYVHHSGSLLGYKSDWFALPDAGIGAVLLTNSDSGQELLVPFIRRLLEVLYDGKPQAQAGVAAAATRLSIQLGVDLRGFAVPDAQAARTLAPRYEHPALGHIDVRREGDRTIFDFGGWSSEVWSRRADDGSMSFRMVDPTPTATWSFVFQQRESDGQRALIVSDPQYEYVFHASTR